VNELRQALQEQIKVLPEAVKRGGVMTATLWKQKAERAHRLLSQPKATKIDLETALSELRNFK
jgi:hypothetical protein